MQVVKGEGQLSFWKKKWESAIRKQDDLSFLLRQSVIMMLEPYKSAGNDI